MYVHVYIFIYVTWMEPKGVWLITRGVVSFPQLPVPQMSLCCVGDGCKLTVPRLQVGPLNRGKENWPQIGWDVGRSHAAAAKLREALRKLRNGEWSSLRAEMKCRARVYFLWGFTIATVISACVGEMFTSLLNVKQAISAERKLIDYLRTYIDHELERLDDIRRWVR